MQFRTVDPDKLRGLADKVFGLTKEIIGEVVGNERFQKEGEAQQAKGTEKLKALRKELEAQAKEAKAELFEQKQKAAQRVKESA
ncbi:MAG: CsbD family protein [Actinobacteria bacterium]|nr:CsbD family protein [Actinomycetota bacterium]MBV9254364.1 CsbD family protein [Actinomycetota bacterium]MBV9662872.1 CsbD family protein [Actinomycetota bacterium]MBV9935332.1 CsbD family protein [Actinomycetota bacterium]